MNILWFVNIPFPEVRKWLGLPASGGSGFWMVELLRNLNMLPNIRISVAWSGRQCTKPFSFCSDGTTYFCVPETRFEDIGLSCKKLLEYWSNVVKSIQPDLVEFHGTEKYYGLLANYIDIPTLVEIQGVLDQCVYNYFGPLGLWERCRFRHLCRQYLSYRIRAVREKKIFLSNNYFIGRTLWDKDLLHSFNPLSMYYECPRIVRAPFRNSIWNPKNVVNPPIFVSTASAKPLKGCDVLIKSIAILKDNGINCRVFLAGTFPETEYGGYLRKLAERIGVYDQITYTGHIKPDRMISIYSRASAFILPSYIENSPNVLAEALTFGMPCVASSTGGILSMIDNKRTGYLFSQGNHIELADILKKIIEDPDMASRLGLNARKVALPIYDPKTVSNTMYSIYRTIISRKAPLLIKFSNEK